MHIYLDNAATTALAPEVLSTMMPYLSTYYGNPSSIHHLGRQTRTAIEQARKQVARAINASVGEIFFTSCGTESNNMALHGAIHDWGVQHIITSALEHHCVLHTAQHIARTQAVQLHYIPLLPNGHLNLSALTQLLQHLAEQPKLVSLMHANNEIGNLLPLHTVAQLCCQYGAYFHTDTVQTLGYYPIDVQQTPIDILSGSAHKFHGPKGVGFIYLNRQRAAIRPLLLGGSQERNMRAGTENVHNIVGLGKAITLAYQHLPHTHAHISHLKQYMLQQLRATFSDVCFNGDTDPQQSHYKILNAAFANQQQQANMLLLNLDIAGICTSGGSACSSGVDVGSHVLEAIDPTNDRMNIRFSFSAYNTIAEIDHTIAQLHQILHR